MLLKATGELCCSPFPLRSKRLVKKKKDLGNKTALDRASQRGKINKFEFSGICLIKKAENRIHFQEPIRKGLMGHDSMIDVSISSLFVSNDNFQ